MTVPPRVFDHLDGAPADQDRHFSRVARRMRSSEWWQSVPMYAAPAPASGELVDRRTRALAGLARLAEEDPAAVAEAVETLRKRRKRNRTGVGR